MKYIKIDPVAKSVAYASHDYVDVKDVATKLFESSAMVQVLVFNNKATGTANIVVNDASLALPGDDGQPKCEWGSHIRGLEHILIGEALIFGAKATIEECLNASSVTDLRFGDCTIDVEELAGDTSFISRYAMADIMRTGKAIPMGTGDVMEALKELKGATSGADEALLKKLGLIK